MQNDDLGNKSYKQFMVKYDNGAARKKIIFDFFLIEIFFYLFLIWSADIIFSTLVKNIIKN